MVDGLCYLDLDPYGRELDDPLAELEQDLVHRLLEEPGSNPDDEDRGVGIIGLLSSSASPERITHAIVTDFKKDPRVQTAKATLTPVADGNPGDYFLDVQIVADETELGITLVANADGTVRRAS